IQQRAPTPQSPTIQQRTPTPQTPTIQQRTRPTNPRPSSHGHPPHKSPIIQQRAPALPGPIPKGSQKLAGGKERSDDTSGSIPPPIFDPEGIAERSTAAPTIGRPALPATTENRP